VEGLIDRRFNESNWWQLRSGWKSLFHCYLILGYALCAGRPPEPVDDWNPDVYEVRLRSRIEGRSS
jgi:hypothetical protein